MMHSPYWKRMAVLAVLILAVIGLAPYVVSKFNATSEKNGLSTIIPTPAVEAEGVTVTDEMVERAAKALYEDDDLWSAGENPWPAYEAAAYRRLARAALTAALSTGKGREGE